MNTRYNSKETPMKYGIMYSESVGSMAETTWYSNEDDRDWAISDLKKTGELEVSDASNMLGRVIKPYAFTEITASDRYWKRNKDYNNEQK